MELKSIKFMNPFKNRPPKLNYFGTDNDSEYEALAITLSSQLKEANKVEETEVDPENGDHEVKVHSTC